LKYIAPAGFVYATAAILLAAICLGIFIAELNPEAALQSISALSQSLAFTAEFSPLELALFILANNTIKSLLAMLAGIFFGAITVLFLIFNGILIGIVLDISESQLGIQKTLVAILPHGLFELTAVMLACANGIFLGAKLLARLRGKSRFLIHLSRSLRGFALIILPLLFVAALVEAFLTNFLASLL